MVWFATIGAGAIAAIVMLLCERVLIAVGGEVAARTALELVILFCVALMARCHFEREAR